MEGSSDVKMADIFEEEEREVIMRTAVVTESKIELI